MSFQPNVLSCYVALLQRKKVSVDQIFMDSTRIGITKEKLMPPKIPVMRQAAPNIPAVAAYSGSTVLGQYIMARDE